MLDRLVWLNGVVAFDEPQDRELVWMKPMWRRAEGEIGWNGLGMDR